MDAREIEDGSSRTVTLTIMMCGYECMLKVISKLHIHFKLMEFEILTTLSKNPHI